MEEKIKCPECGTILENGQLECNNCDYKLRNYKLIAILGYVLSFLFPLAGIFIGFYLHSKYNKNGKIILVISLIMLLIFLIIPWASDINLSYYYYYS